MYVILLSIGFMSLYTLVLIYGYYRFRKLHKSSIDAHVEAINILMEIKNSFIIKEEQTMENNKSLTELLESKPTQEDYEEVNKILIELFQDAYKNLQYLWAKADDEEKEAHFLQVVSFYHENPRKHKEAFGIAFSNNLDMDIISSNFARSAANGEVIDLGDRVEVILNDNTGLEPSGVSPINRAMEGSQIGFNVAFVHHEYIDAWHKHNFPEKYEEVEACECDSDEYCSECSESDGAK